MTCPRLWEVEAARDGRLSGEELAHFEEHRGRCDDCTAHASQIEDLAERLRSSGPPALDLVSRRRLRQAVLGSADAALARASRRAPSTIAIAVGFGFVVLSAASLFAWHRADVASSDSAVTVVAEPAGEAIWRERAVVKGRRFVLDSGTLHLAITRGPGDAVVVVEVPDGTIEDQGTAFSVTVASRHTTSIRVERGAVVFRRAAGPALRVLAGESWAESGSFPPPPAPPSDLPRAELPAAPSSPTRVPGSTRKTGRPVGAARASDPQVTSAPAGAPSPGAESKQIDANSAEDLAYLRIVALVGEGRAAEARLGAKEYLQRFPSGFRRIEVERIATPP
jgi:hypothetical protein